jgi:4'-phosphopantetheinyl transferase
VRSWLERLPALQPRQVAACVASIRDLEVAEQELAVILSDDERMRAATFRFEIDRRRFVMSHVLLRHVVAHRLTLSPREVRLAAPAFERPRIIDTQSPGCISLSHAGMLVAVAITAEGLVGIDVETLDRGDGLDDVAGVLSKSEATALQQVPIDRRTRAFLHCWCGKEAITKALGTGLSAPLQDIDVGIDGTGRVLHEHFVDRGTGIWFNLHHLEVGTDGCACVAAEGDDFAVAIGNFLDFLR